MTECCKALASACQIILLLARARSSNKQSVHTDRYEREHLLTRHPPTCLLAPPSHQVEREPGHLFPADLVFKIRQAVR